MSIYKKLKAATSYGIFNALFAANKPDTNNPFLTKNDVVFSVGEYANSGWTANITQMAVNSSYQKITGPATLRFTSSTMFQDVGALYPAIKYIGENDATIKLELDVSLTGVTSTFGTFGIFKNGVLIADSEFQFLININRSFARAVTIAVSVKKDDVFDVRVLSNANSNTTFRYLSFIATI